MAVPKRRRSKSKKRMHAANWKFKPLNLIKCTHCATPIPSHQVCYNCGYYKGKQVIQVKYKEDKKKDAA